MRMMLTSTASPRQSSPMPGPCSTAPSRLTWTSVPFGEHGVEMRGDDEVRTWRRPGPIAEDVAGRVHAHVLQPELLKHTLQLGAADVLLEGGRRNLAEADLVFDGLRLARLRRVERGLHGRVLHEVGGCVGPILRPRAGGDRERGGQRAHHHTSHLLSLEKSA